MPELTRRRYPERPDCWHVYYGDVHVGTIAVRTGIPHHEDPWGWICGFYPGSEPGEYLDGTAATFDQARADFEARSAGLDRTEIRDVGTRRAVAVADAEFADDVPLRRGFR
jgi:hypothetical protein